ncbi:unnamed protein product, partial [Phaeothamnion confervicola]
GVRLTNHVVTDEPFFCIDPIDGTSNFVKGQGLPIRPMLPFQRCRYNAALQRRACAKSVGRADRYERRRKQLLGRTPACALNPGGWHRLLRKCLTFFAYRQNAGTWDWNPRRLPISRQYAPGLPARLFALWRISILSAFLFFFQVFAT